MMPTVQIADWLGRTEQLAAHFRKLLVERRRAIHDGARHHLLRVLRQASENLYCFLEERGHPYTVSQQ